MRSTWLPILTDIAAPTRRPSVDAKADSVAAPTSQSGRRAATARLCLDDLTEPSLNAQETIRQPLEEKAVTIADSQMAMMRQSDFVLVAALNPCPCGHQLN
jgi:magnesium chelatase family protein